MLDGKMNMVLGRGDEGHGAGDLVHILRNTLHGIKVVEGLAVFFACKSPVARVILVKTTTKHRTLRNSKIASNE